MISRSSDHWNPAQHEKRLLPLTYNNVFAKSRLLIGVTYYFRLEDQVPEIHLLFMEPASARRALSAGRRGRRGLRNDEHRRHAGRGQLGANRVLTFVPPATSLLKTSPDIRSPMPCRVRQLRPLRL